MRKISILLIGLLICNTCYAEPVLGYFVSPRVNVEEYDDDIQGYYTNTQAWCPALHNKLIKLGKGDWVSMLDNANWFVVKVSAEPSVMQNIISSLKPQEGIYLGDDLDFIKNKIKTTPNLKNKVNEKNIRPATIRGK